MKTVVSIGKDLLLRAEVPKGSGGTIPTLLLVFVL